MKLAADTVSIREASESEAPRLHELIRAVVRSDPSDPHLASFRHENHLPAERFVEYAALVDGELAARCQINFRPQPEDINAYGPAAAELLATERAATLAGDLVLPASRGRGLHGAMVQYRLRLLTSLGYDYVMCGILIGNDVSLLNYRQAGFAPIGEKDVDWGEGGPVARVVLYGLRLSDH